MYKEKYKIWLDNTNDREKSFLSKLNESQIKESFENDLSFGTGGIRGIMGLGTSMINKYTIAKVIHGYANYLLKENNNNKNITIVIAYDNRHNSQSFAMEMSLILSGYNIKVLMFEKLAPTPLLSYAVRHYNATGGIMITASHNPKEYNGFKIYNKSGGQLNLEDSDLLIEEVNKINTWFFKDNSNQKLIKFIYSDVINSYLDQLKQIKINDVNNNLKILYSPLHGTGSEIGVKALELQGFNVLPYWDHLLNDPNFSKTVSTNPEDLSLYSLLMSYANNNDCDLILTNDPDADRYGVCVKHNNKFELLSGNEIASLLLHYILKYSNNNKQLIYKTIVTTPLINQIARDFNKEVVEVLTGFKFISEQIEKNNNDFIFGAEESNGLLINDFVRDKDGIQAIVAISEMANYYMSKNMTLVDALDVLYKQYGYYYEQTISVSLTGSVGLMKINKIMDYFTHNDFQISNTELTEKIDFNSPYKSGKIILPPSNVIKFKYQDGTWISIRPSGTEPKIKFYIGVVSTSRNKAIEDVNDIIELLTNKIDQI